MGSKSLDMKMDRMLLNPKVQKKLTEDISALVIAIAMIVARLREAQL